MFFFCLFWQNLDSIFCVMFLHLIEKYFLLVSIQLRKKYSNVWLFLDSFFICSKAHSIFNIFYKKHDCLLHCRNRRKLKHIYRENMKIILIMTTYNVICKYWYYLHNISMLHCNSANTNFNNQKDSCMPEKLNVLSAFLTGKEHKTWPVS